MKSFSEFLREPHQKNAAHVWFTFEVDEYLVSIWFREGDSELLLEAKHKGTPLGGQYSAQLHKAHSPVGQKHIHVYAKQNQLFSLNLDGSAHDQSHGVQIPNKVADAIRDKFPEFTLPPNNFIEAASLDIFVEYLTEVALPSAD